MIIFHFMENKTKPKTLKFKYMEENLPIISDLVMDPGWNPGLPAPYFFHYIWGGVGVESESIKKKKKLVCQFLEGRDHVFTVELFIESFSHCSVETLGGGGGGRPVGLGFPFTKGLPVGLDIYF